MIPNRYRRSSERQITTYEWLDVATKIGYVGFNLAQTSSGSKILTTSSSIHSDPIYWSVSDVAGGTVTTTTETFTSTTLNNAFTTEGDAYVDLPWYTVSNTGTCRVSGAILLNSSTIAEFDTETFEPEGSGNWLCRAIIPGNTRFRKGDTIGLRIHARMSAGPSTFTNYIGVDPANRAFGSFPFTRSTLYLPFKLEI